MSSQVPIVRPMSWRAALPQFVMMAVFIGLSCAFLGREGVMLGAIAFLVYSIGSRMILMRAHRAGIGLLRQRRYQEAIPKFQESFDFLERHAWIDRFRSIVLMSPSAVSYREMALANIAFCYAQLGDGAQCRSYYERCLCLNPQNGLATAGMRMLDAGASAPPKS
ncbi:MAG: tetratricopeptide repeat protein [Planctomycetaceae bacterium]